MLHFNFIIQKLKSKHTSLKKYTNLAKLTYFLSFWENERRKKTKYFAPLILWSTTFFTAHCLQHYNHQNKQIVCQKCMKNCCTDFVKLGFLFIELLVWSSQTFACVWSGKQFKVWSFFCSTEIMFTTHGLTKSMENLVKTQNHKNNKMLLHIDFNPSLHCEGFLCTLDFFTKIEQQNNFSNV